MELTVEFKCGSSSGTENRNIRYFNCLSYKNRRFWNLSHDEIDSEIFRRWK